MSEGGQVAGVGQGLPEDKAAVLAQAAAPPSPVRHPQEGQPPSAAPAPGEPSLGIAEAACELGSPPASGGTPGENAGQAASPQDTPGPRYKRGRGRSFFKGETAARAPPPQCWDEGAPRRGSVNARPAPTPRLLRCRASQEGRRLPGPRLRPLTAQAEGLLQGAPRLRRNGWPPWSAGPAGPRPPYRRITRPPTRGQPP